MVSDSDKSLFQQLIEEAGCHFEQSCVRISAAPGSIRQRLEKRLGYDSNAQADFMQGLETFVEDPEHLKLMLLPARPSQEHSGPQSLDCLVKILLGVWAVQPRLVQLLFDKIPEYFDSHDKELSFRESVPRLILSQLKWIESVHPESDLTSRLLQLIDIAPLAIRLDAINIIPEIVMDCDHAGVVSNLHNVMQTEPECTNAVLDVLSNLNLDSTLLLDVHDKLKDLLRSASSHDLPMVVRYLLQSTTPEFARSTVSELRRQLNSVSVVPVSGSVRFSQTVEASHMQHETLIFEAISTGLKFRKYIIAALLSEIKSVTRAEDHQPFDLWALVVIRSLVEERRQSEIDRVFKSRVEQKLFTLTFVKESVNQFKHALKPHFKHACLIADSLIRSPEFHLASFGGDLYITLFHCFSDEYSRQEILGNILTHTGGGNDDQIDVALDVLLTLSQSSCQALRPFSVFIKGVLDYLENFKDSHIRKLFRILSILSITSADNEAARLDDEVFIHIRKLLSSPRSRLMQHGVIGAVSAVMSLSMINNAQADEEHASQLSTKRSRTDQAVSLLETVKVNCASSSHSVIFLYDELATALDNAERQQVAVKASTLEWINENLTSELEEKFLDDVPENLETEGLKALHPTLPVALDYNLDGSDAQVYLKLLPMLNSRTAGDTSVQKMCALLRLMQTTERASNDGKLGGIDALLGCPILFFEEQVLDSLEDKTVSERNQIALLLFHTSNWFIELLNAFGCQEEEEMRSKCATRANQLLEMLEKLDEILRIHSLVLPRLGSCPHEVSNGHQNEGRKREMNKENLKPVKAKKQKKTSQVEDGEGREGVVQLSAASCLTDQICSSVGNTAAHQNKSKLQVASTFGFFTEMHNLRAMSTSFREFELDALSILNSQGVLLSPKALLAALQELWCQLNHVLVTKKHSPFFKASNGHLRIKRIEPGSYLDQLVQLWPAMRSLFVNLSQQLGASEETMDIDNDEILLNTTVIDCLYMLISIVNKCIQYSMANGLGVDPLLAKFKEFPAGQGGEEASNQVSAFNFFAEPVKQFPTFSLTSSCVFLLSNIASSGDNEVLREQVSAFALWCLRQKWPDVPQKPAERETLCNLLKVYVKFSSCSLSCVSLITKELLYEIDPSHRKGVTYVDGYPSITSQNFVSFFAILMETMCSIFAKIEEENSGKKTEPDGFIPTLTTAVECFVQLVNLTKTWEDSSVLIHCLKFGNKIVSSFIRLVPSLNACFKQQQDTIQPLLKTFQVLFLPSQRPHLTSLAQTSTRVLQHICAHGKVQQEKRMVKSVPYLKKNLERIIFKVKAMLDNHGCLSAFWLGNLKHRNLQGEEVCSQAVESSSDEAQEEEADETGGDTESADEDEEGEDGEGE
ncbi:hypothetical protein GUITHDRAFT_106251 [Guillardia theta CCMP2712]|uniref:Fanconi anemia group D2 protein n=2 Tax=Guillardia theta TaxID=55529 RepID=L1JI48_GUITC|nr:hypothetical protein GUITHDRAFT_106251 [Guillardia theta CCMP2712]EKX48176.1 hypothetical protein GUITHDRAFT_106251 [Guillardia theta CCMP2712]|eukprot:XP_005835156.1 hypothetical protein GUITHDRAFT_106251 [Guillardia theta CCMP2712]